MSCMEVWWLISNANLTGSEVSYETRLWVELWDFPEQANWSRKTHPKGGWHLLPAAWLEEGPNEKHLLSTYLYLSLTGKFTHTTAADATTFAIIFWHQNWFLQPYSQDWALELSRNPSALTELLRHQVFPVWKHSCLDFSDCIVQVKLINPILLCIFSFGCIHLESLNPWVEW